MNFKYHNYEKDFGGTQLELVALYSSMGKTLDEMVELLKPIPRASIRGRLSEIKRNQIESNQILEGIPNIES